MTRQATMPSSKVLREIVMQGCVILGLECCVIVVLQGCVIVALMVA
jgi:hypothetical protein